MQGGGSWSQSDIWWYLIFLAKLAKLHCLPSNSQIFLQSCCHVLGIRECKRAWICTQYPCQQRRQHLHIHTFTDQPHPVQFSDLSYNNSWISDVKIVLPRWCVSNKFNLKIPNHSGETKYVILFSRPSDWKNVCSCGVHNSCKSITDPKQSPFPWTITSREFCCATCPA